MLVAKLELNKSGKNSRTRPVILAGREWRPQFYTSDPERSTSFLIRSLRGGPQLAPGESGIVEGELLQPELFPELKAGDQFCVREGSKEVGHGTILEMD